MTFLSIIAIGAIPVGARMQSYARLLRSEDKALEKVGMRSGMIVFQKILRLALTRKQ